LELNRRELQARLDLIAAQLSLNLSADVALNDGLVYAAIAALERMGIDADGEAAKVLLAPLRAGGQQRMLMRESIAVRAAAVKRKRDSRYYDGY
jgi:ABC-type xylose transport system substrate-binding protein